MSPGPVKNVPAAAAVAVVVAGADTVAVVGTDTESKQISGGVRPLRAPLCSDSSPWARTGNIHNQKHLMKEMPVEIEGVVHTVLPGTMFRVQLQNKHLVLATICGKMRKRWVRLTVGDRVKLEMSPYDLDKARIVWRL